MRIFWKISPTETLRNFLDFEGQRKVDTIKHQIETLAEYIKDSQNIVVITGAGISLSAGGITSASLYRTFWNFESLLKKPEKFYEACRKTYLDSLFDSEPSLSHKALAELEERGKFVGIITTNQDCVHTKAGSKHVAEVQGSFLVNNCHDCGTEFDGYDIWNEGHQPMCPHCGGVILPYHLYSGIGLLDRDVVKAKKWIAQADLILIIGTNGNYGGVYWPYRDRQAKIVQINPARTAFDSECDINIRKTSDEVFAELKEVYDFAG